MARGIVDFDVDLESAANAMGTIQGMSEALETVYYADSVVKLAHSQMLRDFDAHINALARSNPKSLHHMYEFGRVGLDYGKLWRHHLRGRGGNRVATFSFKATKVPVPQVQFPPGRTGKKQSNNRYWFYWKAAVMESGQKVSYTARPGKVLFIPLGGADIESSSRRQATTRGASKEYIFSRTTVNFRPGGDVAGNFTQAWILWWSSMASGSFEKVRPRLEKDIRNIAAYNIKPKRGQMGTRSVTISAATEAEKAKKSVMDYAARYHREGEATDDE